MNQTVAHRDPPVMPAAGPPVVSRPASDSRAGSDHG
jgi:hypothetical protein